MQKPTAFISHITEEGEIARHLKELVERKFLRSVEVFVSSHEQNIRLGDEWLAAIKSSVGNCGLMIVICSPLSVARPWINFEAGAGWVRGIPVVPMCHSGMTPERLPIPLNTLQAGLLGNLPDIQKLFMRLAELANIDIPVADDTKFFDRVREFETTTRVNVLLKDSKFIANLLYRDVATLKHSVYASTRDYEFFNTLDFNQTRLGDHDFTFNDIYRLFHLSLLFMNPSQKVYQEIQTTILRLVDNIRFILSNSRLGIASELEELFNTFLYSSGLINNWGGMIGLLDRDSGKKNTARDAMVKMIKEEPLPPTRKPGNMINVFIDYYDCLVFYENWIADYEKAILRLVGEV